MYLLPRDDDKFRDTNNSVTNTYIQNRDAKIIYELHEYEMLKYQFKISFEEDTLDYAKLYGNNLRIYFYASPFHANLCGEKFNYTLYNSF